MRYGIFSDVHANREALEAVLTALAAEQVDRLLCAGDSVGYGPDPAECLARLQAAAVISVAGNHDWAVAGRMEEEWFNENARAAIEWTRGRMDPAHLRFLADLPLVWKDAHVMLAHGSLHEPAEFHYIQEPAAAARSLREQQTPVAFIGHTHVPILYREHAGEAVALEPSGHRLKAGEKLLVNVGSVGQPRDGDPRAAFGLYDTEAATLEIRRVDYPVEPVQRRMRAYGLPELLIRRLGLGC